ncbi:lysosome-associated membrane glycoprotein 2 isoform X2 [Pyxicephalus adspersus]|uniref:Lysosome-associated membrane glycoprotein 2 n=1 Tax=Pyxicephalus adspersus TaxID=30357 RepID=A0AAV3A9G3_PYXAD|nr:TPA: hypothetical protein GDO54_017758 [Pyxicephalus adspersus]
MERCLCYVTLCLLGLGLLQTDAFEVEIKDGSKRTCIYASMKINFTIEYETNSSKFRNVTLAAPDSVTTEGSSCGETTLLNVSFGNGHFWSLLFMKNNKEYKASLLSLIYNTNDMVLFPDAKNKGQFTSSTNTSFFEPVPLNSTYKCFHDDAVITEHVVQLYWNVTLQAYVENSTLGKDFQCSADIPTTPTANTTTLPSTTATTPKPTPKPIDKPTVGNYSVSNGTEVCLLASMGLQLNASMLVEGKNVWTVFNINPNTTAYSGNCGNETSLLRLTDTNTVVEFYFLIKKKNFYLQEVNVTLITGSGVFYKTNVNLSLWEASLGNSYLCRKEQLISVSDDLYMNTFDVRVQPFSVHNSTYATASECHIDDDAILIPIIVGAALSGLIIIIVIAYLIGRRKTYVGYQTL